MDQASRTATSGHSCERRTRLGDPIQADGWGGGAPTALREDGGQVAISSPTATVLWDLDPDRWVTAACALAGRKPHP